LSQKDTMYFSLCNSVSSLWFSVRQKINDTELHREDIETPLKRYPG